MEIKENISKYNQLCKDYEFLNLGEPIANWEEVTLDKVLDLRSQLDWLSSVVEKFDSVLSAVEADLQPLGGQENTVYSVEEYEAQDFTKEEAPKAQRYDILWNKYVNGQATAKEIQEMDSIQEELGL